MAISEVAICNIALGRIGNSAPISSLDEATAEAIACRVLYEAARDKVLSMGPWRFAARRALLAEIAAPTTPPYADVSTGWAHRYALPADCLVAREVWSGERSPLAPIPFTIEYGETGRVLLCDLERAQLLYTARIVNPAGFAPGFEDALAWDLAGDLALSLKADPREEVRARQQFELALTRGLAATLNEGQADPRRSSYLAARG